MADIEGSSTATWRAVRPSEGILWLSRLTTRWWVAGGWALELFLGGPVLDESARRPHADLDIGILRRDVLQVLSALPSWEFFEAKDGVLTRLCEGRAPRADVHSLWGRPANSTEWLLELMLDESEGNRWVFRRQRQLQRSFETVIRRSSHGIPYLAPEIQLLYKARAIRAQDQADFELVAPRLDADARAWLRNALSLTDAHHKWLPALDDPTFSETLADVAPESRAGTSVTPD